MPMFRPPTRQPDGFLTVAEVLAKPIGSIVNTIGVVEHVLPISKTGGTDLQLTFSIQDKSVTASLSEGTSLRIKCFVKTESEAPKVEAVGDTALLRNYKVSTWRGEPLLTRKWSSECIVFPSGTMPDPHFNDSYASGQMLHYLSDIAHPKRPTPPTPEQQIWAISLRHALCPSTSAPAQRKDDMPRRPPQEKLSLIKNIGPDRFFDLIVEIVRMFPQNEEIYVTDYTENDLLYRYNHPDENLDMDGSRDGDSFNYTGQINRREWPGPFGQMTLQVKLWEPHAAHAFNNFKEGDLVELKNVHVKMDSSYTRIEAAIHGDQRYPNRIATTRLYPRTPRTRELESRKRDYLTRVNNQEQQAQGKQTRKKRKDKKAADKRDKQAVAHLDDPASDTDHAGSNSHVKCERPQEPTWRLADIDDNSKRQYKTPSGAECELPFVNATYRARIRVVDFWPQKLEDFSKPLDDPEYNDVGLEDSTQSDTTYTVLSMGTQRWEWHFCLLVEDAKQQVGVEKPVRLPLLVYNKDAEYLLRLDATDLRNNNRTLAQLREKLFILWGNLAELRAAGNDPLDEKVAKEHSSNGFDCCIKETGVEVDMEAAVEGSKAEYGFQRVLHLCGTTIND